MTVISLQRLPLGFRFNPKDEELINHYLKQKINCQKPDIEVIPEIDVCKCEPWDLPAKSLIQSDDNKWYFFAPKDRKYPNGQRSNRATEAGYWKATGKDRTIRAKGPASKNTVIGMKKTLVFHRGRAPKGTRTCWIMHEYRTTEPEFESGDQGGYVLYILFNKSEENYSTSNAEEIETGGSPPTPSQSSPGDTQHEIDIMEDAENSINHQSTKSFLQGDQKTSDENQPAGIRKWLDGTTDQLQICPVNHCPSLSTDSHEAKAEQVDPLQDFLFRLSDLDREQPNGNDFPHINSPLLPYSDHPFLSNNNQGSHVGLFSEEIDEWGSLDGMLNTDMFLPDRSYVQRDSIIATDLVTSPRDSASCKDSVSSCEIDADVLAQLNMLQKATDMESGSYCATESMQMQTSDGYSAQKSQTSTLNEHISLIPVDSITPDVYSIESALESFQDLLSNSEESSYQKISMANADGPIIEIRSRRSQHQLNLDDEFVHQGTTRRRLRLQSSLNNMFGSSAFSNVPRSTELIKETEIETTNKEEVNKLLACEDSATPQEPLSNPNNKSCVGERHELEEEGELIDDNFTETRDISKPLQVEKLVKSQTEEEPPVSSDVYQAHKPELRMRGKAGTCDQTQVISSLLLNQRTKPSSFAYLIQWALIAILLVLCGGIFVMLQNV